MKPLKNSSQTTQRLIDGLHAVASANGVPIDNRVAHTDGQRLVLKHAQPKRKK